MHEYHDLLTYSRMNPGKNPQDEYHRRFTSPGAYRTGMMIHPTNKDGLPTTDEYELFFVPEHYLLQLMEQVRHLSSQITTLVRRLPKIAARTFVLAMLMDEIKATNAIEGVHSTRAEIQNAWNHRNDADQQNPVRLVGFVKMYNELLQTRIPMVTKLEDIRTAYDRLLQGEIAPDSLPQGQLFRSQAVRIGNAQTTKHIPPTSEKRIINCLENWLQFERQENVPALFQAAAAHFYFEYVHSFADGNGRLGRHLFCRQIAREYDPFTAISFSHEISLDDRQYYRAFDKVEHRRNYGELTFFIQTTLRYLAHGQQRTVAKLMAVQEQLAHAKQVIHHQQLSPLAQELLFAYVQVYFFTSLTDWGIDDREIIAAKEFGKSKEDRKRVIRELTQNGWTTVIKKRPKKRCLSQQGKKQLNLQAIFQ